MHHSRFDNGVNGNVMRVNVDIGKLAYQWLDRPPQRCARGHWLLPEHMIVATIPCSCGTHICWECECGAAVYGPTLIESCSVVARLVTT